MIVCPPLPGQTPILIYTEQVTQFKFVPKQVLESVFIEFRKKSLNSFSHCRTQRTARRYRAVSSRILAFDHREVRFHLADHFSNHDLVWCLSQAQPSVTAPNGFKISCLSKLVRYFHQVIFGYSEAIRNLLDSHQAVGFESSQHQ